MASLIKLYNVLCLCSSLSVSIMSDYVCVHVCVVRVCACMCSVVCVHMYVCVFVCKCVVCVHGIA